MILVPGRMEQDDMKFYHTTQNGDLNFIICLFLEVLQFGLQLTMGNGNHRKQNGMGVLLTGY
jgi:hypothetical protein